MSEEKFDWKGYVCAITAQGGLTKCGYIGRLVTQNGNCVRLTEAFEYVSAMIQQQVGGGGVNTAHAPMGFPVEFTAIKSVEVHCIALIHLGDLDDDQLRPFHAARTNFREMLRSIRPGASRIQVVPNLGALARS
jgi:hypothetical protein